MLVVLEVVPMPLIIPVVEVVIIGLEMVMMLHQSKVMHRISYKNMVVSVTPQHCLVEGILTTKVTTLITQVMVKMTPMVVYSMMLLLI